MPSMQNEWYMRERERERERERKETWPHQFRIKLCLEPEEFMRVASYANFSEVNVSAKHKNPICRNEEIITVGGRMQLTEDIILVGRRTRLNEDIILVGGRTRLNEDIILVGGRTQSNEDIILVGRRMWPSEDTIFASDYLDPFYTVQELNTTDSNTWNYLTVCKQMSPGLFKNNYLQTIHLLIIYIWCLCIKRIWH